MTWGTHEAAASSAFIVHRGWHVGPVSQQRPQRFKGCRWSKEKISQKSFGQQNPRKETFTVLRGWHAGPMRQQHPQRFQGGRGSKKKKGNIQKLIRGSKKIHQRKLLLFTEDDMWDRPANSVLIVSEGAGDQRKKANSQKLGVKNNSKKGNFYWL